MKNGIALQLEAEEQGISFGDATVTALAEAVTKVTTQEELLKRLGVHIRSTTERVDERLADGQNVNSLGELQRTAIEYDQACVLRQEALEWVRRCAWVVRQVHGIDLHVFGEQETEVGA